MQKNIYVTAVYTTLQVMNPARSDALKNEFHISIKIVMWYF